MTWGDVVGTPLHIDDDPSEKAGPESGKFFVKSQAKREELAWKMADDAKAKVRLSCPLPTSPSLVYHHGGPSSSEYIMFFITIQNREQREKTGRRPRSHRRTRTPRTPMLSPAAQRLLVAKKYCSFCRAQIFGLFMFPRGIPIFPH